MWDNRTQFWQQTSAKLVSYTCFEVHTAKKKKNPLKWTRSQGKRPTQEDRHYSPWWSVYIRKGKRRAVSGRFFRVSSRWRCSQVKACSNVSTERKASSFSGINNSIHSYRYFITYLWVCPRHLDSVILLIFVGAFWEKTYTKRLIRFLRVSNKGTESSLMTHQLTGCKWHPNNLKHPFRLCKIQRKFAHYAHP